jgi:hypothetical protein
MPSSYPKGSAGNPGIFQILQKQKETEHVQNGIGAGRFVKMYLLGGGSMNPGFRLKQEVQSLQGIFENFFGGTAKGSGAFHKGPHGLSASPGRGGIIPYRHSGCSDSLFLDLLYRKIDLLLLRAEGLAYIFQKSRVRSEIHETPQQHVAAHPAMGFKYDHSQSSTTFSSFFANHQSVPRQGSLPFGKHENRIDIQLL